MNLENKPDLTDELTIGDLYYNQNMDFYAAKMLKNEVENGEVIGSYAVKMEERQNMHQQFVECFFFYMWNRKEIRVYFVLNLV